MTDKMEQAFIDGTHPALSRNADAMATLRSASPPRSRSPSHSSSRPSSPEPRFQAVDPDPPTPAPAPLRNGGSKGSHNTGVKGVQADYREYQRAQAGPAGVHALASQARKIVVSLDEDDDEDEAEALERYRRERMRELQGSGERRESVVSAGGGRKMFGHLREIGFAQFVSAVEGEADGVAVIVHLYEPDLLPCILLNSHLSSIARAYPYAKFLRAQATELDFMTHDDDDETLPTVLVYRGGELETTWVRFDLECSGGLDGRDARREVEEVLLSKGAIEGAPGSRLDPANARSRMVNDVDDDE
ncbi:hypothetical protein JCM21900_001762 [Sporobolomyces salmonicolor]